MAAVIEADGFTAGLEADAVERCLADAGVRVVRVRREESTLAAFRRVYRDDAFDLVWIAGHGEYDHLHVLKERVYCWVSRTRSPFWTISRRPPSPAAGGCSC